MPSYMEDNIVDALLDYIDNGLSQRQAAYKYGIP
jgi:Psq-like protein